MKLSKPLMFIITTLLSIPIYWALTRYDDELVVFFSLSNVGFILIAAISLPVISILLAIWNGRKQFYIAMSINIVQALFYVVMPIIILISAMRLLH